MRETQEKTFKSLMGKLEKVESWEQVKLTPEEAYLYQLDSLDPLSEEDEEALQNPTKNGS